jgi:hypothetical protein
MIKATITRGQKPRDEVSDHDERSGPFHTAPDLRTKQNWPLSDPD